MGYEMNIKVIILTLILTPVIILPSTILGNYEVIAPNKIEKSNYTNNYNGNLKVYVVELESRWNNYDGKPYHFAFLDYAITEELSIQYQNTYKKEVTWNAQEEG